MRMENYTGGDPGAYLARLHGWEQQRDTLAKTQSDRRATLDAAEQRLSTLTSWVSQLQALLTTTGANAHRLAFDEATVTGINASIATLEGEIADVAQAHEIATARLLGDVPSQLPLVLLPLRLETHWENGTLHVRIYPDVLSVDAHDPTLSPSEQAAGERYWQVSAGGQPRDIDQAWMQLVRAVGPQRAAWIVRTTDPQAAAPPQARLGAWTPPVTVRLLPDRFAVVLLTGGEPINVAASGAPARYVTWSSAVSADPLPVGVLDQPGNATWMTDLATARQAGMAVSIPLPSSVPAVDMVLVVGVRTGATDLAGLLGAQAFTNGLEVLADGAASNNSSEIRAAHTAGNDTDVARLLIDPNRPTALADGTTGAQLADALGLPRSLLAPIAGANRPRGPAIDAVRLLVRMSASGALRDALGAAGQTAWSLVSPAGPAPALRVGRQPYGILPVTAPGRWQPRAGEVGGALSAPLHEWGLAVGPPSLIDPASPPTHLGSGTARRSTPADDTQLTQLLLESASSLRWSNATTTLEGLDALVGPADGEQAPGAYLTRLAETDPAAVGGIASNLPAALLARLAFTAKRQVPATGGVTVDQVNAALRTLAALASTEAGRADLGRLVAEMLDAASHRLDAWMVGMVTERLHALHAESTASGATAIGAFGWLTDLQPAPGTRSYGHIHAPSLAHAATGAVLRSGFLSQRRQAWVAAITAAQHQVAQAQKAVNELQRGAGSPQKQAQLAAAMKTLSDAQAGLAAAQRGHESLAPLDAESEVHLPLALDLSSRRVREGRQTLGAIRVGQPLGAVLGYQFERDLAEAGLQQYLAAFRKLTRFQTGTALEQLEDARRTAEANLAADQGKLSILRDEATRAGAVLAAAQATLAAAQAAEQQAQLNAQPAIALQNELKALNTQIPQLKAALAAIDANRPTAVQRTVVIQVPTQ